MDRLLRELPEFARSCASLSASSSNRMVFDYPTTPTSSSTLPLSVLAALKSTNHTTTYPPEAKYVHAWIADLSRNMRKGILRWQDQADPEKVSAMFVNRLDRLTFKFLPCRGGGYTWSVEIKSDGFDGLPITITNWDFLIEWLMHGPAPSAQEIQALRAGCPNSCQFESMFDVVFDTHMAYDRNERAFRLQLKSSPLLAPFKDNSQAWFYVTNNMTVEATLHVHSIISDGLLVIADYDRTVNLRSLDGMFNAIDKCMKDGKMSNADINHLTLAKDLIRSVVDRDKALVEKAARALIVCVDNNGGSMPDILEEAFVKIATCLSNAIHSSGIVRGTGSVRVDVITQSRNHLSAINRSGHVVAATVARYMLNIFKAEKDSDRHIIDEHRAAGTDDEECCSDGSRSDDGSGDGSRSDDGSGDGSRSRSRSDDGFVVSDSSEGEAESRSDADMDSDEEAEAESSDAGDSGDAGDSDPSPKRVCTRGGVESAAGAGVGQAQQAQQAQPSSSDLLVWMQDLLGEYLDAPSESDSDFDDELNQTPEPDPESEDDACKE